MSFVFSCVVSPLDLNKLAICAVVALPNHSAVSAHLSLSGSDVFLSFSFSFGQVCLPASVALNQAHLPSYAIPPISPALCLMTQLWSNPFDMGCKRNWQQVFGTQPFLVALLPSRRPPPPPVVEFFPLEEEATIQDQRQRFPEVRYVCRFCGRFVRRLLQDIMP